MRLFSSKKTENLNPASAEQISLIGLGETTDEALHATMDKPLEEWLVKTSEDHSLDIFQKLVEPAAQSYQPLASNPAPPITPIVGRSQYKDVVSDYHSNLGKVITILLRSSELKAVNLAEVEQTIVPAIVSEQFIIAETREDNGNPGMPTSVVAWANVSEDVNQRLISNIDQSLQLGADEWCSGDIPWIVFAAGDRQAIPNVIKELVTKTLGGRVLRTRRLDEAGKAFVDEIDASRFEPRKSEASAGAEVGRNHPCPCGSGKRYKHCHGAFG